MIESFPHGNTGRAGEAPLFGFMIALTCRLCHKGLRLMLARLHCLVSWLALPAGSVTKDYGWCWRCVNVNSSHLKDDVFYGLCCRFLRLIPRPKPKKKKSNENCELWAAHCQKLLISWKRLYFFLRLNFYRKRIYWKREWKSLLFFSRVIFSKRFYLVEIVRFSQMIKA